MIKKALTIAGSDCSGGAGIQADLRTFGSLGVYGSSVITAITVQNTLGVKRTTGIDPQIVAGQIDAVLDDVGTGAVKTGMLYEADIIESVADRLKNYSVPCLVVDPVMRSTSGAELLSEAGVDIMRRKLLPLTDFITPNADEASVLCGFPIKDSRDLEKAAREIFLMGPRKVIITGVKRNNKCIDVYYDGRELSEIEGPWLESSNTHGTGCSYSAALAAVMAKGAAPGIAVKIAKKYVTTGIKYSYPVGSGKGPLNHLAGFFPGDLNDKDTLAIRNQAFKDWGRKPELGPFPILNLIIGEQICRGRDYAELTRMAVTNGVRLIQLREKEGDTRQLVEKAEAMCRVCHEHNALFVVNDRVDIAAACGADGVHIGQDDLSPRMARALLGPEKIIGVSAANMAEAQAAIAAGADYLGVGPVYPTISKDCKVEACGPDSIKQIVSKVSLPVLAIGGIAPENTRPLLEAGVQGLAVISAILGSPRPEEVIQSFMQMFKQYK